MVFVGCQKRVETGLTTADFPIARQYVSFCSGNSIKSKQHKEIVVIIERDGHHVELSKLGGTITEWSYRGAEILFPRGEVVRRGEKKIRGGMHACFPNFGPVAKEFGLPQHGPFCEIEGVETNGDSVVFNNNSVWGLVGESCQVITRVAVSGQAITYLLTTNLKSPGKSLRINPGIHPYFRTPQGAARIVLRGEKPMFVVGSQMEAATRSFTAPGPATVEIFGLGTVEIYSSFDRPKQKIVIWRDSADYICVSPVIALPEFYGTNKCPELRYGCALEAVWTFLFIPE